MFLKRITVNGFKSFADRVEFEFGPGVTCIVGPNGCGKSNIVDAFKWVLGEQSARSLRGRQMVDMIFNGSGARRASSVAQVDLLFDNADRALQRDEAEITVTRKLYRSGESEYQLNGESVRLKDIRELFMDTGVGVSAYSVIEQGKVDLLLQSSPVERRVIFEEAAGISKYKARRKEAQRKVERTEQNLLRVGDIVDELERQLRSVKLQAGKARRYQEYQIRLNELKSSFALAEYHRFVSDIDKLDGEVRAQTDGATELRVRIDRHEAEGARVTERLDQLGEEIGRADSSLLQARSSLATQEERAQAAEDRAVEQEASLARTQTRRTSDAERTEIARRQLDEVRQAADSLEGEMAGLDARIDELAARDQTLARNSANAEEALEYQKSGIIELLRQSAQAHNEIVRLSTQRESLVGEQGRVSMRDAQIAAELEEHLNKKVQLQHRLDEVDGLVSRQKETLDQKEQQAVLARERVEELKSEITELKTHRSALLSRQEILDDLERNMEGVDSGARRILDEKGASQDATFDWVEGLVADVFETDVAHAGVIEAALGDRTRHLVVRESSSLLAYVRAEERLPGRLTAIALDKLGPVVNPRDFSDHAGFVACAADLVRGSDRCEQLKRHLFAKVVVVETLSAAMAMASVDTADHRFVTRDGEVVEHGGGRISVGPPAAGVGLISRKSELRELAVRLSDLDRSSADRADQLEEAQAAERHLEAVLRELQDSVYQLSTDRVEANASLGNVTEAVERLTSERPLLAQQAAMLEHQINEVLEKGAEGGRSLEAIERENKQRESDVAEQQASIDRLMQERREVQEELTTEKVKRGQVAEKRGAYRNQTDALARTLKELDDSLEAAEHDLEQCRRSIAEARQMATDSRTQVADLTARIEALDGVGARLRNERDALKVDMDGRLNAIKTARGQLGVVEESLHEAEVSLAQVKVRRDELVGRVTAELGTDLAQLYEDHQQADEQGGDGQDRDSQDWDEVEAEIGELRTKMERLGHVNLDAITELAELEERHTFLTTQRDDLIAARKQLDQLIERLNHESKERFRSAFEQIRENFRGLFRKLFGGGRADIVLEDPEDLLDCGIEIVAQPPGKDLQIISLMSGGEKSLTAIALVMSIFQLRAAPFVLMDEVDAALDEANNERFNRIVQEFVKHTQFIIITHSKWTMNIGDHLYGVTMHEAGVSTRVGVELTDANVA